MSGLEVVGAVAAVVSAFHGGAELVAHVKKKQRRRSSKSRTQREFEEKQLQDSLETGETQIGLRYTADLNELGEIMRVGDAIARDRLLHIAVIMQAEIIKSLQIAVKYENAILNLNILHEASIMNRKDSIVTLDELKQRMLITRPFPRTLADVPEKIPDRRASIESAQTFRTARANLTPVPEDYIPTAVTIPAPGDSEDTKPGLARYFSMKRNSSKSSTSSQHRPTSSADSINFSPALDHLIQGSKNRGSIMKDIDEIITSYQGLNIEGGRSDAWAALNGDSYGNPYVGSGGSKRDTLAILHGENDYWEDAVGLNRDALQIFKHLPPTPEERHEHSEYPAFNHDVLARHHGQSQSYAAPNPLPQRQTTQQSRWSATSASSSVYSDNVPPSLYSHDSRSFSLNNSPVSSIMSTFAPQNQQRVLPTAPHTAQQQTPRAPPVAPYAAPQRTRTPPINPYPIAPFTLPSRTQTPPLAPFASPQRTRTPPIAPFAASQRPGTPSTDDYGALTTGQTRVHLVPGQGLTTGPPKLVPVCGSVVTTCTGPSTPPLVHTSSESSSNGLSIRSGTIQGPTPAQEKMMDGRPCKENNYWGFCKGAWAAREDTKRGLSLQTRPDGLYNTRQIWQCKHCQFQGDTFSVPHPTKKNKKEVVLDPNVHTSAVGIRYKWIFLAKSHVKKKTMESGRASVVKGDDADCNFGCVFCSVEGNVTGIYGNVETLMNHIFLEHIRSTSDKTAERAKCVLGRVAKVDEEWDINIPMEDVFLA